jgi:hypothetical protein
MNARVGGILKGFTIHRKNGSIERYDKPLHNYITFGGIATLLQYAGNASSGTISPFSSLTLRIYNQQLPIKLTGSYDIVNATGQAIGVGTGPWNRIRINSGTSFNASTILLTSTGDYAFVTATSSNIRVLSVDSLDIIGKDLYVLRSSFDVPSVQSGTSPTRTVTYSAGVLRSVNNQIATLTSTTNNTIYSIGFTSATESVGHIFDLETPVVLGIGDVLSVGVEDFEVLITYDSYQPKTFTAGNCPIAGFPTATGRYQRMFPVISNTSPPTIESGGSGAVIYLVPNGSHIAIPDLQYPSSTPTTSAAFATKETITCVTEVQGNTQTNNIEEFRKWFGQVVTGGANIKQIAWGTTTFDRILGILEFDTPQNIPAGKILSITQMAKIVPDFVIPTIP